MDKFVAKDLADKLRGGYYTSPQIAAWLSAWAVRKKSDRVLEPSSGDGAFLQAATKRLIELKAPVETISKNLTGIEWQANEAKKARAWLAEVLGSEGRDIVKTMDFFEWWQNNSGVSFDAVVGNPPFIRYQNFPEPHRARAMEIMSAQGLSPNRLTNIWVPFVVASASSLKLGGRLALVLPAELLQVSYAAQLRSYLTEKFSKLDIIACNELFFEKAEQEVVLLLAEGALKEPSQSNLCRVTLTEASSVSEIVDRSPTELLANAQPKSVIHDSEKWLKYFLNEAEISFMRELRASDITTSLSTHASVDVGVVTGKNEFFVLSEDQVKAYGLEGYTVPLISRSAHLKGGKVSNADWKALSSAGDRVHLLHLQPFNGRKLPKSLEKYIHLGERQGVHGGFKCSVRKPWFAVPSVWTPDGFMFRQIYDFPRIVLNQARATSTDTIHRLTCKSAKPASVIANTYSWLTAASAEIEGRSYGGGVLELEPTEAERLLMPAELGEAVPLAECDRLIRAGRLNDLLEENSRIILREQMRLSKSEVNTLRTIWEKMRDRRLARRRRVRGHISEATT